MLETVRMFQCIKRFLKKKTSSNNTEVLDDGRVFGNSSELFERADRELAKDLIEAINKFETN